MEELVKSIEALKSTIENIRASQIEMLHRIGSNTAVLIDVSNGLEALTQELHKGRIENPLTKTTIIL